MISIIPLEEGPVAFGSQRWDAEMPSIKHPNSVLVFSRKDTEKVTLQVRTQGRIVNIWLNGQEARKIAGALVRRTELGQLMQEQQKC
jgi:hypothetical protein